MSKKIHWCPFCQDFVTATEARVGYYSVLKLRCDECNSVIGTPELERTL